MLTAYSNKILVAGCDEAGRGCLAGSVSAAAVIFPLGYKNPNIKDSKLLSLRMRAELRTEIETNALSYAVSFVSPEIIDRINILNASILAIHQALDALTLKAKLILVDGNKFHPYREQKHLCVVKGDNKYLSIAAASILAKTYRDEHMALLHQQHPEYNWIKNKGYPTAEHRSKIITFGVTGYHRQSFRLFPKSQ